MRGDLNLRAEQNPLEFKARFYPPQNGSGLIKLSQSVWAAKFWL